MTARTITTPWRTKQAPCQARIAPNCAGRDATITATVDGNDACGPCHTKAKTDNNQHYRNRR